MQLQVANPIGQPVCTWMYNYISLYIYIYIYIYDLHMDIHTLEISRIQFAKYAFTLYSIWEIVDAYHTVSQYKILQNNCGHSGHLLFNVSLHSKKWINMGCERRQDLLWQVLTQLLLATSVSSFWRASVKIRLQDQSKIGLISWTLFENQWMEMLLVISMWCDPC